jgi:peptidoglycan L-alanyl-D-glutamate endopeptidase CwlK
MFTLSDRSKSRLEGIEPKLIALTELAIDYTKIDFGVTCGMRTVAEQQELVDSGASQTMDSKHISGQAVDVVAYIGSRITWELNVYDDIADAFKIAAIETDTPIRWGAAWHIPDIREWGGTMEEAMNAYVDLRRRQGRRPFIDAPHFELG